MRYGGVEVAQVSEARKLRRQRSFGFVLAQLWRLNLPFLFPMLLFVPPSLADSVLAESTRYNTTGTLFTSRVVQPVERMIDSKAFYIPGGNVKSILKHHARILPQAQHLHTRPWMHSSFVLQCVPTQDEAFLSSLCFGGSFHG